MLDMSQFPNAALLTPCGTNYMSTKESQVLIGRCGQFKVPVKGDLSMTVTILDVRTNFGRTDVLIQPESGRGGAWVSLDAVTLSDTTQ